MELHLSRTPPLSNNRMQLQKRKLKVSQAGPCYRQLLAAPHLTLKMLCPASRVDATPVAQADRSLLLSQTGPCCSARQASAAGATAAACRRSAGSAGARGGSRKPDARPQQAGEGAQGACMPQQAAAGLHLL